MQRVRRYASQILARYGNLFNDDFEHNKKTLSQVSSFLSKELRNEVAGYITAMIKQQKALSASEERLTIEAEVME